MPSGLDAAFSAKATAPAESPAANTLNISLTAVKGVAEAIASTHQRVEPK